MNSQTCLVDNFTVNHWYLFLLHRYEIRIESYLNVLTEISKDFFRKNWICRINNRRLYYFFLGQCKIFFVTTFYRQNSDVNEGCQISILKVFWLIEIKQNAEFELIFPVWLVSVLKLTCNFGKSPVFLSKSRLTKNTGYVNFTVKMVAPALISSLEEIFENIARFLIFWQ